MTNAELIAELRGHIREVPLTLLRDAADALEAAEQRIAELEAQLPKEGVWIDENRRTNDERGRCADGDTNRVSALSDGRR